MGIFINIGNEGFRRSRNSEYIDKSGLITDVNRTLFTLLGITVKFYNKLRLLRTIHIYRYQEKAKGRIKAMAIWYD